MPKLRKGIKPLVGYHRIGNRRVLPQYLYHATKREYLESIKDFGLVRGFLKGVPGWYKDEDFIWLDTEPRPLRKWLKTHYPDWDWVIIRVNTDYLTTDKVYMHELGYTGPRGKKHRARWFVYKGDILPEAISIVG